jgi:hypothetical protein
MRHCARLKHRGSAFYRTTYFQLAQGDLQNRSVSLVLTQLSLSYKKRNHFSWIIFTHMGIFSGKGGLKYLYSLGNG